jgi:riboflavin synthase
MFTGLVEEVGTVAALRRDGQYQLMTIRANTVLQGTRNGDSISIDGACQTVTAMTADSFTVETLAASLEKTTLGSYRVGRKVHLERALTPDRRLGGHFVQGHIDGTAQVRQVREEGKNVFFTVTVPEELLPYCVSEGSIAIDGVSLTIAALAGRELSVNVIPATWNETVLRNRKTGDAVNIEVDILGRYVARMLGFAASAGTAGTHGQNGLTAERLAALGY